MHPIDALLKRLREEGAPAPPRPPGAPRWLVLAHFALAAAAFWLFVAAFAWGSDRLVGFGIRPRWALGLVHTLTLGWVATTLLGALLQMSSSHGGTPLFAPRLAAAAFALLASGLAAFVSLLWAGSDRYWLGAAAAAAGVLAYLVVLGVTLLSARQRDVTWRHFVNALAYLAALAALGALLAWDRQRGLLFRDPDGALVAHAHLALVGWVSLSIAGASYRLVPAVAGYRRRSRLLSRLLRALLNAGLLGLAADALFLGRRLEPLWASLLAGAYACWAWQALAGPRPEWTPSQALTDLALAGGALWTALGLALATGLLPSDPRVHAAYVFVALLGWVTPHILAQTHKIFPFLVWLALSRALPEDRVPAWEELAPSGLAWAEAALLAAAVPLGALGFLRESEGLLRAAGALLLACGTAYLAGALRTFSYLRPRR